MNGYELCPTQKASYAFNETDFHATSHDGVLCCVCGGWSQKLNDFQGIKHKRIYLTKEEIFHEYI